MAGTPSRDFISITRAKLSLRAEVNEAVGLLGDITNLYLNTSLLLLLLKKETVLRQSLFLMAGTTRLELATSCVTGMRSNQLSYAPMLFVFNFQEMQLSWFKIKLRFALSSPRLRSHKLGIRILYLLNFFLQVVRVIF